MPQFNYIIRTNDGVREEGIIDADNINEASEKLRTKNYTIIQIKEKDTSFDFLAPFLERLNLTIEKFRKRFWFCQKRFLFV